MKKLTLLLAFSLISFSGCQRFIMKKMADGLSGESEGSVFTRDNDPQLMADALPVAMKIYEAVLEKNPENPEMYRATASVFCSYSYAFIQFPADTLPSEQSDQKLAMNQRAKRMYLRARDYGLAGLEVRHPGFRALFKENADSALALTTKADIDLLYWTGLPWMGAFTADKFDMKVAMTVPKAVKVMKKVAELDSSYGAGAIDEFLISFYGAMPSSMGGDTAKARYHFERAVKLTEGKSAGPYISYASAVAVPAQNRAMFDELIGTAVEIKPEENKNQLLFRTIQNLKANWYYNHADDLFVGDESDADDSEISDEQDSETVSDDSADGSESEE